jgi:hypothetical protein
MPFTSVDFAIANMVIHGVIDWNIWRLYKWSVGYRFPEIKYGTPATQAAFKWQDDDLFFKTIMLDQFLHGATLMFLAAKGFL